MSKIFDDGSRVEDYRVDVEFTCPFCLGDCVVMDPPAVVHSAPACPLFMVLDVVEFLHAVNAARRALN